MDRVYGIREAWTQVCAFLRVSLPISNYGFRHNVKKPSSDRPNLLITSRSRVTVDEACICNRIYWPLTARNYRCLQRFCHVTYSTVHYSTHLAFLSPVVANNVLHLAFSASCVVTSCCQQCPLHCPYTLVTRLLSAELTADDQSTSSSWYRAPLWGPWPDFKLILSLETILLLFFL
jgi:hypothetical protein